MTPARRDAGDEASQEQCLRQLGVPQEAINKHRRRNAPDTPFTPWAWHVDAMKLFGGMRTQWRAVAAVGGLVYLGLDYASLAAVKAELGFSERGKELFDQLQAIERGALTYLNSRHEQRP